MRLRYWLACVVMAGLVAGGAAAVASGTQIVVRHAGGLDRPAVFDVGDTIEVAAMLTAVPPGTPVTARWVDSYGRHVAEQTKAVGPDGRLTFRFPVRACVSTGNWIAFVAEEEVRARSPIFGCAPQHTRPLRDWYVFPWAQYPKGTGDTLRRVGVNGGMAYRNHPFDRLVANDLRFYVDQMAHRIFCFCRRHPKECRAKIKAFDDEWKATGVANTSHLVNEPCLSDPKTLDRLRTMVQDHVRPHAPYKPVWYNVQDEGGLPRWGDFCFGPHCLAGIRKWLRKRYGSLDGLNAAWRTDFKTWDAVRPLTRVEIRKREQDVPLAKKRLAPWCDHRAYMEDLWIGMLAKAREFGREIDPDGLFGMTGPPGPHARQGFDFSRLPQALDIAHSYEFGSSIEIMRSIFPRYGARLFPYPGWDWGNVRVRRDWHYLLHGLSCTGIWDTEQELLDDAGRPTNKVLAFKDTWLELQRGIGRLFINAKRDNDAIGVHFSQPSLRVRTLVGDDPALKGVGWDTDVPGAIRALEDLGLQYQFVAYYEVEKGFLRKDGIRLYVLLNAIALSDRERAEIDTWVEAGGVLVTDSISGLFNEHGNARGASIAAQEQPLVIEDRGMGKVVRVKRGMLSNYAKDRLTGGPAVGGVKRLVGRMLGLAGLAARIPVRDGTGGPAHGVETVMYTDGPARYVAIIRNPGYDRRLGRDQWQKQLKAFPDPIEITTRFDGRSHVYDMRAGKYRGKARAVPATLPPWEPVCYARLPYPVTGIDIDVGKTAKRGSIVPVTVAVKAGDGTTPGHHVLRVNIHWPDGSLRTYYSRNLDATGGKAAMRIPLALNDAVGAWTVRVRDVATGTRAARTFTVE